MEIMIVKDHNAVSQQIVFEMLATMHNNRNRVNIAPAGGSSPVDAYQILAPYLLNNSAFAHVHYYMEDEVPYRDLPSGAIFNHLNHILFKPCGISQQQIHRLTLDNVDSYDEEIRINGGIDLMLLGIGGDGHIAGNLPGASFDSMTTTYPVTEDLVPLIIKEVGSTDKVPRQFASMGPRSIMQSKRIIMIANGAHKADILKAALQDPLTEQVPASILRLHPNCLVIADEAAAAKLI